MTIKHRIQKLEARLGIRKMYVFRVDDDVDTDRMVDEHFRANGIDRDQDCIIISARRFQPGNSREFVKEQDISR